MKKIIKILIIEMIILAIIFSFLIFRNNFIKYEQINIYKEKTDIDRISNIKDKDKLYIYLEKALLDGQDEINLIGTFIFKNPNIIFETLEEISFNNPRVMYYTGAKYNLGKLEIYYSKTRDEIKKHQNAIETIKEEFLTDHISSYMTDYEKVLKVHDYIINNGKYDVRLLKGEKIPEESYSTYGILYLGIGVCESYAKSMKFLLDGLGIKSQVVVGESKNENHAWNLVCLEGDYYHIDSTWNDPIIEDGGDLIRYNFFNLNDKELSITHTWDRDKYPEANGELLNYYYHNKLIVDDKNMLESQIKEILFQRELNYTAKILNFNEEIKIDEIIERLGYKYYKQIGLSSYYYSIDKEKGIVSIKFFYD